ncbi:MAG: hypothetical protein HQK99_02115 [Nitrospirae bacterium]|nr:hypothetical protein [Nitrospirota bacterium]
MNKVVRAAMLILLFSAIVPFRAYAQDSSFTQQDRDRLTRLEEGLKATNQRMDDGFKALNQRIDDVNRRMDDVNHRMDDVNRHMDDGFNALNRRISDLYGLMYVLIGGMLTLVGFVLWDRRTTLAPVVRKNRELEERGDKIERVLKELALKDPNVAETLKHVGL